MFVTKVDGRKEPFQKEKIIRTCLRNHASRETAEEIASRIESKAYDGIKTRKILKMILDLLKEYKPVHGYHIDLREAIGLLKSKPDFEEYIRMILKSDGYRVEGNKIVNGFCVKHEIDGIANKNEEKILLQVKHHINHHVYLGLETCLEYSAALLDMNEGGSKFDKLLIACNTKYSTHAKKYANCKGILLLGWKHPKGKGLEDLIEKSKLYPVPYLVDLREREYQRFSKAGIITLKQLVKMDIKELRRTTKLAGKTLENLKRKSEKILGLR